MPPIIETRDLVKEYGRIVALRGVSLRVERGEIYGLLGQNGAGKTTLVKILLGITRHWRGDARLFDRTAGDVDVRRHVGYLPEDHQFPEYHTAWSLLHFYGELLGVPRAERRRRIPEVLDMVNLTARMHSKIRTYSKGMKQRVGVAQALMHDPGVIFLDEPTDGVDPVGRTKIRAILQRLKDQGKTIFLNSHLLGEVELICDRVGILQRGEMVREGDVESLTRQKNLYVIGLAPGQEFPEEEARGRGFAARRAGAMWEVELTDGQSIDPVVDLLRARGLGLRHLTEKRQTLEDLFLRTVEDHEPGTDGSAPPRPPAAPDERFRPAADQIRPRA